MESVLIKMEMGYIPAIITLIIAILLSDNPRPVDEERKAAASQVQRAVDERTERVRRQTGRVHREPREADGGEARVSPLRQQAAQRHPRLAEQERDWREEDALQNERQSQENQNDCLRLLQAEQERQVRLIHSFLFYYGN